MTFAFYAQPADSPELAPEDPAPPLALERETLMAAVEKAAQACRDLDRASRLSDWGAYAHAAHALAEVPDIRALARSFAHCVERALSGTKGGSNANA